MLALKDSCFDDIERLPTSASSCRNRAIVSGYRERVKMVRSFQKVQIGPVLAKRYKFVRNHRGN